jgi:hypothetical protein
MALALPCLALVGLAWWWFAAETPAPSPMPSAAEPGASPESAAANGTIADSDALHRTDVDAAAPAPVVAEDAGSGTPVPTGTLRVFVHSETGAPLPGCKVEAAEHSESTDDSGRVAFTLPAGRVHVAVTADAGRHTVNGWQVVRAGEVVAVSIQLALRSVDVFCLRVVRADGGLPVARAQVTVRPGHGSATPAAELTCDRDGRAETQVDSRVDWLELRASGFGPRIVLPSRGHETPATAFVVPLEPAASLHVATVDAAGTPVAAREVTVTWSPWDIVWPVGSLTRGGVLTAKASGGDGVVRFADLPSGVRVTLVGKAPEGLCARAEQRLVLAPGTNEARMVFDRPCEIRGTVRNAEGGAAVGAQVGLCRAEGDMPPALQSGTLDGETATTDAAGEFRLPCAPGTYFVGVAPLAQRYAGRTVVGPCVRVEVPAGGAASVELQAVAPLSIAGRAISPDGTAAAGVELDAAVGEHYMAGVTTDAAGRFEFRGLLAGEYALTAGPYAANLGLLRPVIASAGDRDVVLQLVPARGTLRGRLVDAAGLPTSGWVFALQRDGDEGIGARCDLDGTFTYSGLAAGTWDVRARDWNGRVALQTAVTVAPGQEGRVLELVLLPGAMLRPRHATATSFKIARGAELLGGDYLEPDIPGEACVPPGEWTVVFFAANTEIVRATVRVAAGDDVLVAPR